MSDVTSPGDVPVLVELLGWGGVAVFFGRFYIQWVVSELKRRVVVPVAFWYMSSIGCVCQFLYGAAIASPMGTLSQSFNLVIYARNLAHIWREKGVLSRGRDRAFHGAVFILVGVALAVTAWTWYNHYRYSQTVPAVEARQAWFWLGVGLVGQALFALRFAVQWFVTERRRKSVVPTVFWYISLVATVLLGLSYLDRREWPYVAGLASTLPVYTRNIWLSHFGIREDAP